jgi:Golgi phosphoprotein 3 (GPP34)
VLIAEAIMLVLIDPVSGKFKVDPIRLETVLGGALTSDLEVLGLLTTSNTGPFGNLRVTASHSESGKVVELPVSLQRDFLLTQGLQIAAAKSFNGPRLVGKLGRDVRTTTLERFVDQGIVEARPEKRWLGMVHLPRWPMLNTAPVNEQNRLMYDALIGQQTPDPHTRALIGLLHCLDITHKVVPLDNLPRAEVRTRAKQVAGKSWITSAVRALVAAQMPG